MSTTIMALVWPMRMGPSAKAVLVSLADNANDQGECWPSIKTICRRTCLGRTAVIEAIKRLETVRLLVADRTNGRHTRYQIITEMDLFNEFGPVRVTDGFGTRTGPAPVLVEAQPVRVPDGSGCRTRPDHPPNQSGSRTGPVREADSNRQGTKSNQEREINARDDNAELTIIQTPPQRVEPQPTTPGVAACIALKAAGMPVSYLNPSHPDLLLALDAGVTANELADIARERIDAGAPPRPLLYVIKTALSRRQESQRGTIQVNEAQFNDTPQTYRPSGQTSHRPSAIDRVVQQIHDRAARQAQRAKDAAGG